MERAGELARETVCGCFEFRGAACGDEQCVWAEDFLLEFSVKEEIFHVGDESDRFGLRLLSVGICVAFAEDNHAF